MINLNNPKTLDEAIEIIKEINPEYEETNTRTAETMVLCAVKYEELVDKHTIDAVPVKRGEWVEYPYCLCYEGALTEDDIACSSCGAVFNVIDNCTEKFKYCPNCGARMDEE